jgi:hypothetical protein
MADSNTSFRLVHEPSGILVARVICLDSWWAKGRGVIGMPPLTLGEGVWLPGVSAVHTLFVSAALDLLFLDAQFRTRRFLPHFPAWRLLAAAPGAHHTLELGAGTLTAHTQGFHPGDSWRLEGT